MKWLALFAIMLVGCCVPVPVSALEATDWDSIAVERVMDSSVQIQLKSGPDTWVPIGSGTIVHDNEIGWSVLTANHVAEASQYFWIRACMVEDLGECRLLGSYYSQSAGAAELAEDWAVMPFQDKMKGSRAARLGRQPDLGSELWMIGSPHGLPVLTHGTMSMPATDQDQYVYVVQGFAYPGSSGGGVFNSHGQLVGITVAGPVWEDVKGPERFMEDIAFVVPVQNCEICQ